MEESKEGSSDSSSSGGPKDKLVREILSHTLACILKQRMKPELFQIFQFKYSVCTIEQNQVSI